MTNTYEEYNIDTDRQVDTAAPISESKKYEGFPTWFAIESASLEHLLDKDGVDIASLLSESRKDFQTAWAQFFSQVQNIISLHIVIYTSVVAIVYFVLQDDNDNQWLLSLAGILLFTSFLVGHKAQIILSATFDFYVSSVVYSCQLHLAAGACTHRWFELVRINLERSESKNNTQLLKSWADKHSTYHAYHSLIKWLGYISLIGSMTLVFFGLRIYIGI